MTNSRTIGQEKYTLMLESGAKTTGEMAMELCISGESVARMMKKFRDNGIIQSVRTLGARGGIWRHTLIDGWQDRYPIPRKIPTTARPEEPSEEVLYAAELRNELLIGRRLNDKFKRRYPGTSDGRIRTHIREARTRHLI